MFPMTATERGAMLLVTRADDDSFAARFLHGVGFIEFSGARDPYTASRLEAALKRDWRQPVRSLRRDFHPKGKTCWLHADGWCLSRRPPVVTREFRD
jgi:protein-L-isoaspartate(D-aspartate) O-methyltransferase